MDGVEVMVLCSVSQNKTGAFSEGKESTKQESQDKSKYDAMDIMEEELKTMRSKSTTKSKKVESAMMCWESTRDYTDEEPHKEPEKVAKKQVEKTEKNTHGEEHVKPTPNTGNRLKISIEEISCEKEDDRYTLEMEETEQEEIVYITHLEDGL